MSMIQALMGGGPLPLPKLPCAVCLALDVDTPDTASTLAGGTLTCPAHVRDALGYDRMDEIRDRASVRQGNPDAKTLIGLVREAQTRAMTADPLAATDGPAS